MRMYSRNLLIQLILKIVDPCTLFESCENCMAESSICVKNKIEKIDMIFFKTYFSIKR